MAKSSERLEAAKPKPEEASRVITPQGWPLFLRGTGTGPNPWTLSCNNIFVETC